MFEDAKPDDGRLDIGVVTADGPDATGRARSRVRRSGTRIAPRSSARRTRARSRSKLDRKVLYELDGGDRDKVKSFKVKVEPDAVTVCVPTAA